jgi:RND family efflux transporter MFP subunit
MPILKQVLLSLLLVVIAGGGWLLYQRPDLVLGRSEVAGDDAAPSQPGGGPGGPGGAAGGPGSGVRPGGFGQALVVTAAVGIDDSGTELRAIGTAAAARSVTIYPQVSGIVATIDFMPGSRVTGGEVLVRLDSADQQVALDRANIALASAREALDRAERLEKSGNVTASALSDARKAVQQAEIDVRMAELDLAKRTIRAPFDGVIGLSDISVGDLVGSSTAIATVADMRSVTVAFEVPERVVGDIAVGQEATATAAALPGAVFTGRISAIDNRIDPATRTLRVEAILPNEADSLKPGMAVAIGLSLGGTARPSVPSLAIQWDRDGSYVWRLDGDTVRRVPVQIVSRRSGVVTVAGALQAGDEVVVEGVLRLREGMTVVRANEGGEAAPPARPESAPAAQPGSSPPVSGSGTPAVPRAAAAERPSG